MTFLKSSLRGSFFLDLNHATSVDTDTRSTSWNAVSKNVVATTCDHLTELVANLFLSGSIADNGSNSSGTRGVEPSILRTTNAVSRCPFVNFQYPSINRIIIHTETSKTLMKNLSESSKSLFGLVNHGMYLFTNCAARWDPRNTSSSSTSRRPIRVGSPLGKSIRALRSSADPSNQVDREKHSKEMSTDEWLELDMKVAISSEWI